MKEPNQQKLEAAVEAMRMVRERNQIRESLKTHWMQMFSVPANKRTLSLLTGYALKYGEEAVRSWIDSASINEIPANQALRYINAIRPKKDLEDEI